MYIIIISVLVVTLIILLYLYFRSLNSTQTIHAPPEPEPPPIENWTFHYSREPPHVPTPVEEPIVDIVLPPVRYVLQHIGRNLLEAHARRRRRHIPTVEPIPEPEPEIQVPTPIVEPVNQTEEIFDRLAEHNDDGQNVHNKHIRKALTDRLLRILELNKPAEDKLREDLVGAGVSVSDHQYNAMKFGPVMYEIRRRAIEYFNGLILREPYEKRAAKRAETDVKLQKIEIVLSKISNGFTIEMSDGKLYNEDFIINTVWSRINHEDNKANREILQIALIDNLIDSAYKVEVLNPDFAVIIQTITGEQYITRCINGRVARVLTSLILLDADPKIAEPERDEKETANEAYATAYKVLNDTLQEQSDELNRLYGEDIEDLTPEQVIEVKNLENLLKAKIHDVLRDGFKDSLEVSVLDEIIRKAQTCI